MAKELTGNAVEKQVDPESSLSKLDHRELTLVHLLLDVTFEGTRQEAAEQAGYKYGRYVYRKLREPKIQAALVELRDRLQAELTALNLTRRYKVMQLLYKKMKSDDISPYDLARLAEVWGRFEEGAVSGRQPVINNSVTAQAGIVQSEADLAERVARIRTVRNRIGTTDEE